MGTGVGFRVAPGVRLQLIRRGPRMSLGPRIARVGGGDHDDTSAATSSAHDWGALSGGGHAPPSPRIRSASENWASVRDHLDGLLSAHDAPVTRAVGPVAPPPPAVDRRSVRRQLRDATADLGVFDLAGRLAARRRVSSELDAEVVARARTRQEQAAADQAAADAWWERLVANDPATVTARLEAALRTHDLPAVVTTVAADRAYLVIPVDTPGSLVGQREPTLNDDGETVLRRLNRPRRHELYEAAITSAMLAVAAEAFAVAPGLEAVTLAVVCPQHLGGPAVLLLAELSRELVLPDGADRPAVADLAEAADAGRATLIRDKGARLGALRPLDPKKHGDVAMLLEALETG